MLIVSGCVFGRSLLCAEDLSAPGGMPAVPTVSSTVVVSSTPVVEPYLCPVGRCASVSKIGGRAVPGKSLTEMHEGADYPVMPGQSIRAARSGRVLFAGFSRMYVSRANKTEQQRLVIVLHDDRQSSRYVHLNSLAVRPPQRVKAGDVLGTAAESDEWTEPVLHFEIRNSAGKALNPDKLITTGSPR